MKRNKEISLEEYLEERYIKFNYDGSNTIIHDFSVYKIDFRLSYPHPHVRVNEEFYYFIKDAPRYITGLSNKIPCSPDVIVQCSSEKYYSRNRDIHQSWKHVIKTDYGYKIGGNFIVVSGWLSEKEK